MKSHPFLSDRRHRLAVQSIAALIEQAVQWSMGFKSLVGPSTALRGSCTSKKAAERTREGLRRHAQAPRPAPFTPCRRHRMSEEAARSREMLCGGTSQLRKKANNASKNSTR
jgi:hypothetical protein